MRNRLIALATVTAAGLAGLMYNGQSAIEITAQQEGKRNAAYADPGHGWEVPTICYGSTRGVRRGMWRSDAQCMDMLQADLDFALADLRWLLGANAMLTPGEVIAYSDFTFNVGRTKLADSTWRKKFLAGDRVGACYELPRWRYSNGVLLNGLIKRRAIGKAACLSGL